MLLSGIVDENVQAAKMGCGFSDGGLANFFVSDVTGQKKALPAFGFNLGFRLLGVPMFIQIRNRHPSAFLCKKDRYCPPDPAVSARDERDFSREFAACSVS